MDKKLTIGIEATANRALTELNKITSAQHDLSDAVKGASQSLSSVKKEVGNVRAFEKLNTSLGFTKGQIEDVQKSLDQYSEKQKKKIGLNDSEQASVKKLQITLGQLNQKFQENGKLSDNERKRLISTQTELNRLNKKRESYYQLTKKEQAEVSRLSKKLGTLTDKEKQQTKALSDLSRNLKEAGLDTKDLAKAKDIANRRSEKAAQLLERENRLLERQNRLQARKKQALSTMGEYSKTGLKVGGAALVAGGLASGKLAIDNEASFVDVAKTLNFTKTEKEIREEKQTGVTLQSYQTEDAKLLRLELNKIAETMAGVNASDVMAIAAGGANGGIAKDDLAQYTRDTIQTATAWDMTAEDAAAKGMAIRNSFGYKDDESTPEIDEGRESFIRMGNMINDVANNNGGVSGRDLLGVMSRTGALLTNSGFSEAGALGLSGALLSKGSTEEEAATATKNISKALTAGFSATQSQQDVYSMIGLDAQSVSESMQDDATGTLVTVLEGIKQLDATEQSAAVGQLFGQEAAAHVQKLLKDTQVLRKIQQDAANASNTSVKDEYDAIASTNKAKVEETLESVSRLGVAIGDKLLPVTMPLFESIGDIASELADFINESESAGTAISSMVGLVGVLGAGFAAFKAYKGIKFARNLAGIASETIALKNANNATDNLTRSLNSYSKAANQRTRRRSSRGRDIDSRRSSSRRRKGFGSRESTTSFRSLKKSRKSRLLSFGIDAAVNSISGLISGEPLSDMGSGLFGGRGDAAEKNRNQTERTRRGRRGRRRKKGLFAAGLGLVAGGLSFPSFAGTLSNASDAIDTAADLAGAASDVAESLPLSAASKAVKFIKPLSIGLDAVSMAQAVASGDTKQAVTTGGSIAGGMGGAAAGAALGTAIFPVVGTAIGGALGGFLGSEAGASIASTVADWFAPKIEDKTQQVQVAQAKESKARQMPNVTFAPQVTVQGGTTSKEDAEKLMQKMQNQLQEFADVHGLTVGSDLEQDLNHSLVS